MTGPDGAKPAVKAEAKPEAKAAPIAKSSRSRSRSPSRRLPIAARAKPIAKSAEGCADDEVRAEEGRTQAVAPSSRAARW